MQWRKPVQLTWNSAKNDYTADDKKLMEISDTPGIYIFAKKHGKSFTPIYVGYSAKLRNRIIKQLNNHKLMVAVGNAGNGSRWVLVAQPKRKPGQTTSTVAKRMESFLIRKFQADGWELLNEKGVRRSVKTVRWIDSTEFRALVPLQTQIEK